MIDINHVYASENAMQYCTARVTAVHKERYELNIDGHTAFGRLKSSVYYSGRTEMDYPTVGDLVQIQCNPVGDSLITQTLPRHSYFARRCPDVARGEQAVAANFDYVFVLTALNNDFNPTRIERYMAIASQSGAIPVIVFTKADMCADYSRQFEVARKLAPDTPIYAVSAHTGFGMDALNEYLQPGSMLVLLGSSGVGKSSLLNALVGEDIMRVNNTRDVDSSKGRHTTTYRQLVQLPSGAMIIDTPGMRELGMWDASEGVSDVFADVEQFIGQCRFRNCNHGSEPGCAVKAALESGELPAKRWRNYLELMRETAAAERRNAAGAKRHSKSAVRR